MAEAAMTTAAGFAEEGETMEELAKRLEAADRADAEANAAAAAQRAARPQPATGGPDEAVCRARSLWAGGLLAAQRAVVAPTKDAQNEWHKYRYVKAETMIQYAREALHAGDMVAMLEGYSTNGHGVTDDGYPFCWLSPRYVVIHAPSGQQKSFADRPWFTFAQKGRELDKAMSGTITQALAYFLRDLLLIPKRGEGEPDIDERGDNDGAGRVQANRPTSKPSSAPAGKSDAKPAGKGTKPAPAKVVGEGAAERLEKRLLAIGGDGEGADLAFEQMVADLKRSGHKFEGEVHLWPASMLPHIKAWLDRADERKAAASQKPQEPPAKASASRPARTASRPAATPETTAPADSEGGREPDEDDGPQF